MDNYAILDETGIIINVVACDPSQYPVPEGSIDLANLSQPVWIGWSTPDNGVTWVAPPEEPGP